MRVPTKINFKEKFSLFTELWTPKLIAQCNDHYVKAAKLKGEFVWHQHDDTDEMFIVMRGCLTILLPDGHVELEQGECFIIPKGTQHKPVANQEVDCLIIEKAGTLNTGNHAGERTVSNEEWI